MPAVEQLAVEIAPQSAAIIIKLSGPADMNAAAELDRKLLSVAAQRPSLVIFDLSGMNFISSICMGSLVRFMQGIGRAGGRVALASLQSLVLEAFQRARLDKVFAIHPTVADATASK